MKTLWEAFMDSFIDGRVWKIYESGTRKLLCKDYGSLQADDCELDDRPFVKAELKKGKFGLEYWRVVVE